MQVVILCGGMGTRLREETEVRPKPMVEIGGHPVLWHIMKTYSHHGYRDFILCLGYKGEMIRQYFHNFEILNNDFTVDLSRGEIIVHRQRDEHGWSVTLSETGLTSKTGSRVKQIERYVDSDLFMVTYGDGVTDLDVSKLVAFHKAHGRMGTVTGVSPPSRYGELLIEEDRVTAFREKPPGGHNFISGGYFVFSKQFFDYLSADPECVLEREPLEGLARDGELKVYNHGGFWQCMDTFRDFEYLKELWDTGCAPWDVSR